MCKKKESKEKRKWIDQKTEQEAGFNTTIFYEINSVALLNLAKNIFFEVRMRRV
jgi:hypothetical protein